MKNMSEYDLAYICYYSEKIELPTIAAGFASEISNQSLQVLIQELKDTNQFDYYKKIIKLH
ncbi:hypothetical protein [Bacillus mycoides]|uniref:hypothetical protein n=1 Tax=Bacillus mycoides TaxID=1405 RepID=UPI001C01FD3D|nr:hypothetical protein [Bacillus mycoides]MED1384299.1 hypothetical protein [Bacillus mycoides]QWI47177.1 hypothetical protein EXW55_30450 [Bacillus mycoides]